MVVCRRMLLAALLLTSAVFPAETEVEVALEGLGRVRGKQGTARSGDIFQQFLGIPFAEPPTGNRRFRPPAPAKSWGENVRDATTFGPPCMQMAYSKPLEVTGSEDCLFLNIFTRNVSDQKPVLVLIHGGVFIDGDTTRMTGEFLMEEEVVVVTLQYRLGPMGWLTTADSAAPGNYGLQDQVLALRWIQHHIASFGGDRDLVTLAGMSAGGASVNYLLLSPQTHGLFHRAVSMSGSAMAWWANIPHQETTAHRLAETFQCPSETSEDIIQCLQQISGREIMEAQAKFYPWNHDKVEKEPLTIWSPRPDPEAEEEAMMPIQPAIRMVEGQMQPVPFLVGVAESEGVWQAANYLTQDAAMTSFLEYFDEVAKNALGLPVYVKSEDMAFVLKKIKEFYLGTLYKETDFQRMLDSFVSGMIDMYGDAAFNYPIDNMVKLQSGQQHSPVWVYQYRYKHNHSLALLDPNNPGKLRKQHFKQLEAPTHGHDCSMLFPLYEAELGPLSEEETEQSRQFIQFIARFMVTGDPRPEAAAGWSSVSDEQELSYYAHDVRSSVQKGLPHQKRMKFWNNLPIIWRKNLLNYLTGKMDFIKENHNEL